METLNRLRAGIIIISDRAAEGSRPDRTLPIFARAFNDTDFILERKSIVSDDPEEIERALYALQADNLDIIFTSGGTGFSPRDNTPEVTRLFVERLTPGLDEAIRSYSQKKSPYAIYSRAVSGIRGRTLVINLPGSPDAVQQILEFLLPTLEHPLRLLKGEIKECHPEGARHD